MHTEKSSDLKELKSLPSNLLGKVVVHADDTGKVSLMRFHQVGQKLLRYTIKRRVVMLAGKKLSTIEMLLAKNKRMLALMMQIRWLKTMKIRSLV